MKKNGYLRKFIAMFLVFVMLMADSSMTTFAETVGSVRQQNADQGVAVQDGDDSVALFSAGKASMEGLNFHIITRRMHLNHHHIMLIHHLVWQETLV